MNANQLIEMTTENRAEWLGLRKIGSSDAAAVVGLNPYRSMYRVWAEKVGVLEAEEESEAMRWGSLLEPVIAAEFEHRTGLVTLKNNALLEHPEHSFMTATVDYWVTENGEMGILECKNTGFWAGVNWEGNIPDSAHVQVAHQLAVTGLKFAYIAALIGGNRLVWHRIERDEALIATLIKHEADFWAMVESRTAPALESSDNDLMSSLYPVSHDGELEFTDPSIERELLRLEEIKAQAKRLDDERDQIEANIKAAMGENERAHVGQFKVSWKTSERETLDSKALKAAHPEIAAQFVKTSTTRTFRVTTAKEKTNGHK